MLFNSPLHVSKAGCIIEQFNLKPGSHVLDVGCGEGEFLIRVAECYQIEGLGIDVNHLVIQKAQAKADQRIKSGNVIFTVQDANDFLGQGEPFDLIVCIGAEFIFGGYQAALQKLKLSLAPQGLLLMGTLFWKQEPAQEYLQLMGGENLYFDHATTVELALQQNFLPLYICRSNEDEWDDFESSTSQRKYLEILNQPTPSSPDAEMQIAKIQQWQNGYLKWGIDTLGFGFYLLRGV